MTQEIELRDTSELACIYKDGDEIKHPAGPRYVLRNHIWVKVEE